MRRRSTRGLLGAGAALGLLVLGLGGCTFSDVPVVVAGRDTNGTLVVGATDCKVGGLHADEIRVFHTSEVTGRSEIWAIEDHRGPGAPTTQPPSPAPAPPARPSPGTLDIVDLVSVGDPDPLGWEVTTGLAAPIPEGGRLEVEVKQDTNAFTSTTVALPPGRDPDLYSALVDEQRLDQVDGATLAAAIEETCDEATAFDGGLFLAITGGTAAVVLAGGVALVVLAVRQFGRAGAAHAARRAGEPPPGTGPA